jgi:hypothetical protein
MKKKKIEFEWIEEGMPKQKKQISITGELKDNHLDLISVKCLPAIECITCEGLHYPSCSGCDNKLA